MWPAWRRPAADPSRSTTTAAALFHRVRAAASALRAWRRARRPPPEPHLPPPNRIVLYFTTLGVVRKTFEDCRDVRSILHGFRVAVDERDVSMDPSFLRELGEEYPPELPKVFVGGRCLGGAEEIRRLHEAGELKAVVEDAPLADLGVCQACGGVRFILCWSCDGSHRSYCEDTDDFVACDACNENGLVRCPECNRSEPV